jgi:hypothetical protein
LATGWRDRLGYISNLVEEYLRLLKTRYGGRLVSVCVFGSAARGELKEDSDIDVLLVVRGLPEDVGSRIRELRALRAALRETSVYKELIERKLPRSISEVVLTPEEVTKHPPIMLDMTVDAVIIHDEEGFLRKEIEKVRRRLEELGAIRLRGKEGYYWVLKPDAKFGEVIKI